MQKIALAELNLLFTRLQFTVICGLKQLAAAMESDV